MLKPQAALRKDKTTKTDLQHRHFAFIAQTLKSIAHEYPGNMQCWEIAIDAFANACAATNPKFDRARFMRACSYTRGIVVF